ncbi:MAG: NADH-quinone oxidoreductase subunit L [Bacteroidia bacterium]
MNTLTTVILIPGIPFSLFVLLGLFGRKYLQGIAGYISLLGMLCSLFLSINLALNFKELAGANQGFLAFSFEWLRFTESMSINMGFLLDPLSIMMLLVVTFVSSMVQWYSLGYMKGEERYATYYSFLSLFTFSMLGLVLSSNIFQIYMFWELVGVSSFLLIGYYFHKETAVAASKKAFIVTRFADFGFLIGILILSFEAETLDFSTLINRLAANDSAYYLNASSPAFLGLSSLNWGLLLVLMGGAGKSAMFPLHIWLPDAMEGPTPVSALIHAATMVVAGVFLVGRLFPIFVLNEWVMGILTFIGVFSALFAAIIACTQTDIKRVLAYSTMSQIGFMMFALGVSGMGAEAGLGFSASFFHLFTHAFFKSLLFLSAGTIIHLVHSNDMSDMGGLRKYMPITHFVFLMACLAISGIPPFSGFFSKEEILLAAYHKSSIVYGIALITSGLTAFYMFRLYFKIFWNKEVHVHDTHHAEGTWSMKIPLMILAIPAVLSGFIPFGKFISSDGLPLESHLHLMFSVAPVLLALVGIVLAYVMYQKESDLSDKMTAVFGRIYQSAYHKFYIDEIYLFITKGLIFPFVGRPAAWFDKHIIDAIMVQSGEQTHTVAGKFKFLQSGKLQDYMMYFFAALLLLFLLFAL